MRDVNKVILIGRLGSDPVQKETKSGLVVASFSLATSRRGKEDTEPQTQWHKVVVWGKQAEACTTYLKKGHSVYVEGIIKARKYESKDGSARTTMEVHAEDVSFLGGAKAKSLASEETLSQVQASSA